MRGSIARAMRRMVDEALHEPSPPHTACDDRCLGPNRTVRRMPASVEVGSGNDQRRIAVRARPAPRRAVLARRLQFRHDRHQGAGGRRVGRANTAAPACGSTIPAMANPAAALPTARSRAGWRRALAVFSTRYCEGPQIVIGSSMGGWMALLLAREIARHPERYRGRLAGLVLIAPAPDFTEALMWNGFSPAIRAQIETTGQWLRPSDYGEPYPITSALIEDGRNHLLLGSAIETRLPGADPAGRAGRRRAVAPRLRADRPAALRRRRADHDPGRRPSAVAPAGHRKADRDAEGILLTGLIELAEPRCHGWRKPHNDPSCPGLTRASISSRRCGTCVRGWPGQARP